MQCNNYLLSTRKVSAIFTNQVTLAWLDQYGMVQRVTFLSEMESRGDLRLLFMSFYLTMPTMSCTGKQQAALRKLRIIHPGRFVRQPGWALTLSPLILWGETNNMGLNPFMLHNCQAYVLGQSPTRREDGVGSQDAPLVFPGQSLTMILPSVLGARSINTGSVLLIFWKASLGASL